METSSGEPKLNDHIRIIENHIQYNKNKFFQFLSQFLKMKWLYIIIFFFKNKFEYFIDRCKYLIKYENNK